MVRFVSSMVERALGKGEVKVRFFHEAPTVLGSVGNDTALSRLKSGFDSQ